MPHTIDIIRLGFIDKGNGKHESNEVISSDGLSPTICAGHGVKFWINHIEVSKMNDVSIVAMRGRDKNGQGYEQYLEPNYDGTTNTITTVEKDNLVLEKKYVAIDEQNKCIRDDTFGTLMADGSSPKHNNRVGEIKKIRVRQATKSGYTEIILGGGGKSGLPNKRNEKRQSAGNGADKSYADNGEYP